MNSLEKKKKLFQGFSSFFVSSSVSLLSTLSRVTYFVNFLCCQSLVSEEDDDEDEEEGKTAVQPDEKNKNNKPGLNGIILFS